MSRRDFRTVNGTEGQKIESDLVTKRIGDLSYRNIGENNRSFLFNAGKALITENGLRVEPSSGMTINVPSGVVFQRSEDVIMPCVQTSAQTVTLDAATGVARTDIIEAKVISVTNKDDTTQIATVASGSAVSITNETIKRDIQYYLSVRKQTNTTTSTSSTSATLTGTIAISGTIDLSEIYLLNLADGEDGSFQEIDLRGSTPEATTRAEIIANINAAVGRTMATTGGGDVIVLTGESKGLRSFFSIKPPVTNSDLDALNIVFGVSIGGVYRYDYQGSNEWFKLAEIDIGTTTTVVTSGLIRNVDKKDTWSDATDIIIKENLLIEQNLAEWNKYDSNATYSQWDVVWIEDMQFVSLINSNTGNYPIKSINSWGKSPSFNEIVRDYNSTLPIYSGIKNIDNPRDGAYKQWEILGYYKKDNKNFKAYKVKLDGTVVTGDSDLEIIFDPGGSQEYPAIDVYAPDSGGTRTLVDLRGRVFRPSDGGGGDTENVGNTQEDAFQGHTYTVTPTADINQVQGGTSYGAFTINSGSAPPNSTVTGPITDGVNGTPRINSETRMKNYTIGVPYIVILLEI